MRPLIAVIPAVCCTFILAPFGPPAYGEAPGSLATRTAAGPAESASAQAARWIGRLLKTGGGTAGSPTDWGLTEDAVIALSATGYGGKQIARTARLIRSSGAEYIGTRDQLTRNWPRVAKTALTLQVAGLNTTTFRTPEGNRDLVKELRSVRQADGSFGASDFPFVHSLAIFALARTPGGVPAKSVRWLRNQQCRTAGSPNLGAYGSGGCSAADADDTALAIQALRAAGVSATNPSVALAGDWLIRRQTSSGGFASTYGADNANTTGLATQALRDVRRARAATAGKRFIKGLQVKCTSLKGSAFTSADIGAIAYDRLAWDDAREEGITSATAGQWFRASTQATLGLRGSRFDQLSVANARPGLPKHKCATKRTTVGAHPFAVGDKRIEQ